MRITRLKITNYAGLAALEVHPPSTGAMIAKGRNAIGKSTVLRAIRAALEANDIGPDAIRHGEESAEILVDLGDISVRRAITKKGTSLTVSRDGMDAKKPQHYLDELLGTSGLDPLALMTLPPKARRAHILAALPCKVTREQLLSWAPDLPANVDTNGHGLEVVETVRKVYYDRRTAANAKAKELRGAVDRARAALGDVIALADAPKLGAAMATQEAAKTTSQRLALRIEEAEKQVTRQTKARETIQTKTALAASLRADAPPSVDQGPLDAAIATCGETVRTLEEALQKARVELFNAERALANATAQNAKRSGMLRDADAEEAYAIELSETLMEGQIPLPTQEETAAARQAVTEAGVLVARARGAETLSKQLAEVESLEVFATQAENDAERLDQIVRTLSNDAPRAIVTEGAIPGLQVDGEEILLDGKSLDALSGREQMKLCIEIARRSNVKARFLVVDGLERVDPDTMDAFIAEATRDGFQLIGTRVDRGELVVEHIEHSTLEVDMRLPEYPPRVEGAS